MQPQENPCRVLLGLNGNSTEGFFFKEPILFSVYCLIFTSLTANHDYSRFKIRLISKIMLAVQISIIMIIGNKVVKYQI